MPEKLQGTVGDAKVRSTAHDSIEIGKLQFWPHTYVARGG